MFVDPPEPEPLAPWPPEEGQRLPPFDFSQPVPHLRLVEPMEPPADITGFHMETIREGWPRAREAVGLPPERRNSGVAVMAVIAVAMLLVGLGGLLALFAGMQP